MDSTIHDAEIIGSPFIVYRKDRNRSGGGILVAIKSNLYPLFRQDLSVDGLDLIWVQCKTNQGNILVGCCYWSKIPGRTFLDRLEESISKVASISHKFKSIILTGDFNIDDRAYQTSLYKHFGEVADILNFYQAVDFITRYSRSDNNEGAKIDHVYINTPELIQSLHPLPALGKGDHVIVSLKLKLGTPRLLNSRPVLLYHRLNVDDFIQTLNDTPWDLCFTDPPDVNISWNNFKDLFIATIEDLIPKAKPKNNRRPPWITNEIIRLVRKKRRLFRAAKSNNSDTKWTKYKGIRNLVKYEINKSYASYVKTLADDVGKNPKRFWSFV